MTDCDDSLELSSAPVEVVPTPMEDEEEDVVLLRERRPKNEFRLEDDEVGVRRCLGEGDSFCGMEGGDAIWTDAGVERSFGSLSYSLRGDDCELEY